MKRLFALLALGAALGGIALRLAGDRDAAAPDLPPAVDRERSVEAAPEAPSGSLQLELLKLVSGPFGDAERAAVETLATRASHAELESLARFVAALPNLRGRRAALDALLARYAALDKDAAVALARELGAVDELFSALQRNGALDLPAALRDAERLPPAQRRESLARLAAIAVEQDAPEALAYGARLEGAARAEFLAAVFREWARRDPEAMLHYVVGLDSVAQQAALEAGGLEAFSQLDPERLLAIAEQMPGDVAQRVRLIALMGRASSDPLAAISYAETLPPGAERTQFLALVARGYAAADPEGALAWAQSLRPPAPTVVASVLAGLARVDPQRVLDVLFMMPSPRLRLEQLQSLIRSGSFNDEQTAALASRWPLSPSGRQELRSLTAAWARQSPEPALEWLLANGDRAHRGSFAQAAQSLGREGSAAADAYLTRIPSELRPLWIKAAADGYAQADPTAAARWLAKYTDESGYDAAMATVAQRTAQRDPPGAARLLASIDVAGTPESIGAVRAIAARWTVRDVPAARAWALGLPSGDVRNAALTPVLAALVAERGAVEPGLLAAFSDDSAGQRALSDAIVAVARSDAGAAQRLADQYLVDPELRRQVGLLIARLP